VVLSSSDGRWARDDKPGVREHFHPLTLAEVDRLWQGSQREWARRLAAVHVVADAAGRFVHRDEPDLIAHVVAAVLDAVRADAPVRLDQERVAAVAGRVEVETTR
jgi:hypothetical protein